MDNNKKPSGPVEEERWAQEIQLSHLDNRFSCQIDGTVIQNVKDYSLVQSSNVKLDHRDQCGSCVNHDTSADATALVIHE